MSTPNKTESPNMSPKQAPQKILSMRDFETRVNDAYSMIKICRMQHMRAIDYLNEHVYNELARKHGERRVYSAFMQGYVAGLIAGHRTDIDRNHLEFCYLIDGILHTTAKTDTGKPKVEIFYGTAYISKVQDAENGHVWKGTNKIYSGFDKGTCKKVLDRYTESI